MTMTMLWNYASAHLRYMIGRKFLAGVTNAGQIAITVRDDTRVNARFSLSDVDRLENVIVHQLSLALTSKLVTSHSP